MGVFPQPLEDGQHLDAIEMTSSSQDRRGMLLIALVDASDAGGVHAPATPLPFVPSAAITAFCVTSSLRGILWNPLFRPSHDSLIRQNEEIDRLDLPRIQDDDELEALKASGDLVPIIESDSLKIERGLDPSRRFCRPWTRDFVQDLSEAYYHQFHAQIQVNSAVRTVKVQKKLRRHNRNAAPADGDTASSHLAGVTVDLQRRGLTKEADSLRRTLLVLPECSRPGRTRRRAAPLVLPRDGLRSLQRLAPDADHLPGHAGGAPARRTGHYGRRHERRLQLTRANELTAPLQSPQNDCAHGRTSRHRQNDTRPRIGPPSRKAQSSAKTRFAQPCLRRKISSTPSSRTTSSWRSCSRRLASCCEKIPHRKIFLDGRPFSRRYQIDRVLEFARELSQPWKIIECTCSDESARQRLDFERDPSHPAQNRSISRSTST